MVMLPVVVPGLVALPPLRFAAEPRPVTTATQGIPLTGSAKWSHGEGLPSVPEPALDGRGTHDERKPAAVSGELEVGPFLLAAITWTAPQTDPGLVAWLRSRSEGVWSEWKQFPLDDEHGPDPGSTEAAHARNGTAPLIVAQSDGVRFGSTPMAASCPTIFGWI